MRQPVYHAHTLSPLINAERKSPPRVFNVLKMYVRSVKICPTHQLMLKLRKDTLT